MAISEKVKAGMISGNYIRKMFEEGMALKKIHGEDKVFDLSIGNPLLEPPEAFNIELKNLIKYPPPGLHLSMEDAGYAETREAISAQLSQDTGIKFDRDDITMTFGAAGAVNVIMKTLLNPGDEILSITPNYFEYASYADNHGGTVKYVPSDSRLCPDFAFLESAINAKTKALIINSPNNPTGNVYSNEILNKIADIVSRRSSQLTQTVYIISDDVYSHLYYGEGKCPRMAYYYPHTIIANSFSKDLSLPGERVGYVAVHQDCAEAKNICAGLSYCNRVLGFMNAPSIMQKAICRLQSASVDIKVYRKKRDFLYDNLTKIGYSVVKPEGAFYIFPRTPIEDDVTFVQELKDQLVLTTPGSAFKAPGYFRISYCTTDQNIEGALVGLRKAIEKYKLKI